MAIGEFFRRDQHGGRTIGQRRGGARRHGAFLVEGRLQAGQNLLGRIGADQAVLGHIARLGVDRHDLVGQTTRGACLGGLLLAGDGELLLLGAGDLVLLRNILGGLAHAHIGSRPRGGEFGIGQRVIAAHRHAAHRLDPGADERLARADLDLAHGDMDGRHGRSAEAVHRHAADRERQVRQQADEARDVHPLLALGKGAAQDDVLDLRGIDAGPVDQATNHLRGQVIGTNPCERALASLGEGRAGIACDHDVGHPILSLWACGLTLRCVTYPIRQHNKQLDRNRQPGMVEKRYRRATR